MNNLEQNIYKKIEENSEGINSNKIAELLNLDVATINIALYNNEFLKKNVFQSKDYKWHIKKEQPNLNATKIKNKELSKLCNYYLNCLSLEESNDVSAFLSNKNNQNYSFTKGLKTADFNELNINYVLNENRENKIVYLGYPVRIYSIKDKREKTYKKIAPLFLMGVTYSAGKIEISHDPSINIDAVRPCCNGTGNETIATEVVLLESELGLDNPDVTIGIEEVVLRLKTIRSWNWKEEINPYSLSHEERIDDLEEGIYNKAILIGTESNSQFTKGLIDELISLSKLTEENYKGTALYDWIKGNISNINSQSDSILEVLPLNSEQHAAIERALSSNLSVITGPPGTGKSQVVTDLLINIAWRGERALFSSKNNKAVNVVSERANALSSRPFLLRLGNFSLMDHLAKIIEKLLASNASIEDKNELVSLKEKYSNFTDELKLLRKSKEKFIEIRNQLDNLEHEYSSIRDDVSLYFDSLEAIDVKEIKDSSLYLLNAISGAIKEKQSLFIRILWSFIKNKRECDKSIAIIEYNKIANKYNLEIVSDFVPLPKAEEIYTDNILLASKLEKAKKYKDKLYELQQLCSLEEIDKKILLNRENSSKIAKSLWDKWLQVQSAMVGKEDRKELYNFATMVKLHLGESMPLPMQQMFKTVSSKLTRYLQCWAVTSLSAKSKLVFAPGIFDYVIIDEASQCDIASILPLLYRAKKAVIIGDPNQLSHITTLQKKQDAILLKKYNVDLRWSYSVNSLYDLALSLVDQENLVQLRDHFRSCADIIEFSNEEFYNKSLRIATKYSNLKAPSGTNYGISWIDVKGKIVRPSNGSAYNNEEADAVIEKLQQIIDSGFTGTIGVTTPFRAQVQAIKKRLEKHYASLNNELVMKHEFIVDTVHKFQGDERDVMVFSSVISEDTPASTLGFLNSTKYIFNVAITRARAILYIVGNMNYCAKCGVEYLEHFVNYYNRLNIVQEKEKKIEDNYVYTRDYPNVVNPEEVSDWEKLFYTALYDEGISTLPQYQVEKYRLDLALILHNGKKLDIEIDGEMYHKTWNGELCYHDQLRNQRLYELEWDVKRFWVYQIRDELPWCVSQIKEWIKENT